MARFQTKACRQMFFREEKLEVEFSSELYLPRAKYDRVVDRRCRSVSGVVVQHTDFRSSFEIDARDIRRVDTGYVGFIEDVKSFSEQLKTHMLSEMDPLRNTQVRRPCVRATVEVTQERDPQHSTGTVQRVRHRHEIR